MVLVTTLPCPVQDEEKEEEEDEKEQEEEEDGDEEAELLLVLAAVFDRLICLESSLDEVEFLLFDFTLAFVSFTVQL